MFGLRARGGTSAVTTGVALARAGFRRYATYRQATLAAAATNTVFGFLRCFVLLAVVGGAGQGGTAEPSRLAAGYTAEQIALYTWASQGYAGAAKEGSLVNAEAPTRDPS